MSPEDTFVAVKQALAAAAQPDQAVAMASYMKDRFPFYGVKAPRRKQLVKPLRPARDGWTLAQWAVFARLAFSHGEARELQYVLGDWDVPAWAK